MSFLKTNLRAVGAIIVFAFVAFFLPPSAVAQFAQQGSKLVGTGATGPVPPSQGVSAAISGDGNTVIVGGTSDGDFDGAAWVFTRSGGAWSQQGSKLVATFTETGPFGSSTFNFQGQGSAVALSADGNTALVGAGAQTINDGAAIIWNRSGGVWTQGDSLFGSNPLPPNLGSKFGASVSLSADGNTAVVGSPLDSRSRGGIWVFTRSGGSWTQQGAVLRGSNAKPVFDSPLPGQGASVAISGDGNTIIAGAPADNGNAGAAWVFTRSGGSWSQQSGKLVGTTNTFGNQQGGAVALSYDGSTAIVGGNGSNLGAAWIWTRSGSVWTQQAQLVGTGYVGPSVGQGSSVALSADGNTAIVGGLSDNSGVGATWVFTRSGGVWTQQGGKLVGNDSVGDSAQGRAAGLSADASTMVFGGFGDNNNIGAAWVYVQSPTVSTVTPNFGTINGGTSVTIKGTGFTSISGVTFGSVAATGVTIVDPTTITAVTPAHVQGAVDVVVTNAIGSITATGAFTYRLSSATSLGSAQNPSTFGGTVDFTATVTAGATGTVAFKEGSSTLASVPLSGNTAIASLSLDAGSHSITAVYGGDSTYLASTSSSLSQTVNKVATSTGLAAAPTAANAGQTINFTATIGSAAGPPGGSVTFTDGAAVIGTSPIASGQAVLATALTIGAHNVVASFPGDSNYLDSSGSKGVMVSATVGGETRANTFTTGSQQLPAVARLNSGYVLVWASNPQDGSGHGVYAQRYTVAGAKVGSEFRVNTTTKGDQTMPAVAGLKDGGFVVVWQSDGQDGSGLGVYGQRFTATGAKAGAEFRANATTAKVQSNPAVAGLAGGGFVVAWQSNGAPGTGGFDIYIRRFDSKGTPALTELRVNKTIPKDQTNPSIAALTGGGFVVAWQGPDASGLGVYAQRFDANGGALGGELRVNTVTVNDQSLPSVGALDNGGFVIAWQSALQDGSGLGVYMQRYTSAGVKSGGETRANTMTANDQWQPSVAGFTNGGFIVVWSSKNQDGSGQGVYAQAFDDAGAKVNVEFRVNTTTASDQWQPKVAAFASGNFVATWTSTGQDTSQQGVYAQRFLIPGTR